MVASVATPTAAASCRCAWYRADARPVSRDDTWANAPAFMGITTNAQPRPMTNITARNTHRSPVITALSDSHGGRTSTIPDTSSRRGPTRG